MSYNNRSLLFLFYARGMLMSNFKENRLSNPRSKFLGVVLGDRTCALLRKRRNRFSTETIKHVCKVYYYLEVKLLRLLATCWYYRVAQQSLIGYIFLESTLNLEQGSFSKVFTNNVPFSHLFLIIHFYLNNGFWEFCET